MRGNREDFDVTRGPPHRTPRPHLAFELKEKNSCARTIRWREILLRRLMRRTNTTTTRSVVTRRERFPAHVTVRTRDRELVCLFVRFTRVACHLQQVWSIDHEHQLTQQICRSHSTAVRCHARPFRSSLHRRTRVPSAASPHIPASKLESPLVRFSTCQVDTRHKQEKATHPSQNGTEA